MPKIIYVDAKKDEHEDGITESAYKNRNGHKEYVEYDVTRAVQVVIYDSFQQDVSIFVEDIPKLILALQATHKHITNS